MIKPGDRVRRVRGSDFPEHNLYKDKIYTVRTIAKYDITLKECTSSFEPGYFELVETNNSYEIY